MHLGLTMTNVASLPTWPESFRTHYRQCGYWTGELLTDIIQQQALIRPNKIAFIEGDKHLTYGDLSRQVNVLAMYLQKQGLQQGDSVVLHLPNVTGFFVAFFALLQLGVKPVLALPAHRGKEIEQFAEQVNARAYIMQKSPGNNAQSCPYAIIAERLETKKLVEFILRLDDAVMRSVDRELTIAKTNPLASTDSAFYLLSGGTTGIPKLIARTHDDYFYSLRLSAEICAVDENTRYLAVLPVSHNFILSSPGALGVLFRGGTVVLVQSPDPQIAFQCIAKHQVSMVALVPPMAIAWLTAVENARKRNLNPNLQSLKLLQVGGAKLSESIAKKIEPIFNCRLQQVFGMAEGLVNYTRLDNAIDIIVKTQGLPMSVADEIRIVDDNDVEVAPGESGNLLTRGPYTIRGYVNAPEHNRRAFTSDGFYRTGDIVRQTASGHLIVTGRNKDQINRGGEKISAEEIENDLLLHSLVTDVAVVAMPDDFLGERSCAFIVAAPDIVGITEVKATQQKQIKHELVQHLRNLAIADFKIPDCFAFVAQLPKTKFGKIDKNQLRHVAALYVNGYAKSLNLKNEVERETDA